MKMLNIQLGLICWVFLIPISLSAQQVWSLEKCYELAIHNATFEKERSARRTMANEEQKQKSTAFYPSASLNGVFTTQSDVMKIPLPNIETLSKEQYRVSLDLEQLVYDGGFTERHNELIDSKLLVENSRLDIVASSLKNRVADLYLGIILLVEKEKLMQLYLKTLETNATQMHNKHSEGIVLKSNVALIEAEVLKAQQILIENSAKKQELLHTLSVLIGENINEKGTFVLPKVVLKKNISNKRAELKMFEAQKETLRLQERLVATQNNPKIALFASGGNALPGYNMLNPNADWFYIIGAKFTLPLTKWNTTKHEKASLRTQQIVVDLHQENFMQQNAIEEMATLQKIEKFELLLSKDDEIIAKRKEIADAEEKRLLNGVTTASDYTIFLDAYQKALIEKELHKIQRLKAILNYQYIKGNN